MAKLGSRGLQNCLLRLQATTTTRHHGSWFHLRNFATCSLILLRRIGPSNLAIKRCFEDDLAARLEGNLLAQRQMLVDTGGFDMAGMGPILEWALAGFRHG